MSSISGDRPARTASENGSSGGCLPSFPCATVSSYFEARKNVVKFIAFANIPHPTGNVRDEICAVSG
ncbi:hypothetical protein LEP1GSC027_4197 [Leptospira interrogans str. 2002000624]|nr:hypothetical protein LEP1GSC027_4197 [Leptospira interrogans str. 2002000624]